MASEADNQLLSATRAYPQLADCQKKRQPTTPKLFLAEKLQKNDQLLATRHYISRSHESLDSRGEPTSSPSPPSSASSTASRPPLADRLSKQMALLLPPSTDRLLSLRSQSSTYPPMEKSSSEDPRLHLGSNPYISRSQEFINEVGDHILKPSKIGAMPLTRLQPRRDSLKLPKKHDRLFHSRQQPSQSDQQEASTAARLLPEVALDTFKLRVPSTKWRTDSTNGGGNLTQWKSEPRLSGTKKQNDKDTSVLDKWELLQVAARISSAHCNLHVLLGISETAWQEIRYEHGTTTQQMLHLLLAWQHKDGVASRKKLITALRSARLDKLASQVQDRSYYSEETNSTADDAATPLLPSPGRTKATRTVSSRPRPTHKDMPQEFVCQSERRRGSAPVLQRQMTQNTLKGILQSMGENVGIGGEEDEHSPTTQDHQ